MPDFTSALYLGLRHPNESLPQWDEFSTGLPAALFPAPGAEQSAAAMAELIGTEAATLAASTLHLVWDLFSILAHEQFAFFMDSESYAISRWGVERAACRNAPVQVFAHHDVAALAQQLANVESGARRPAIVADGFCPGCGRFAPLPAYLAAARRSGGILIIDDTQALGVFGRKSAPDLFFGKGGGGSLRWHNMGGADVLVLSSLAKGFGVPIAVLAGSAVRVQKFEQESATRVYCSPPDIPSIRAAQHALAVNRRCGDLLRRRLAGRIRRFKSSLQAAGLPSTQGWFPLQTIPPIKHVDPVALHRRLADAGIRTVLHSLHSRQNAQVSFLLTARHTEEQIDSAVNQLGRAVKEQQSSINHRERKKDYEQPIYV